MIRSIPEGSVDLNSIRQLLKERFCAGHSGATIMRVSPQSWSEIEALGGTSTNKNSVHWCSDFGECIFVKQPIKGLDVI